MGIKTRWRQEEHRKPRTAKALDEAGDWNGMNEWEGSDVQRKWMMGRAA